MNQEPGFADEVVVIFGDGEVVDRLFPINGRDRFDLTPVAGEGGNQFSGVQVPGVDPMSAVGVAALDPERMPDRRPNRILFSGNVQLQQLAGVPGDKVCDLS